MSLRRRRKGNNQPSRALTESQPQNGAKLCWNIEFSQKGRITANGKTTAGAAVCVCILLKDLSGGYLTRRRRNKQKIESAQRFALQFFLSVQCVYNTHKEAFKWPAFVSRPSSAVPASLSPFTCRRPRGSSHRRSRRTARSMISLAGFCGVLARHVHERQTHIDETKRMCVCVSREKDCTHTHHSYAHKGAEASMLCTHD